MDELVHLPRGIAFRVAPLLAWLLLVAPMCASERADVASLRAEVARLGSVTAEHSCIVAPDHLALIQMDFHFYGSAVVVLPRRITDGNKSLTRVLQVYPRLADGGYSATAVYSERTLLEMSQLHRDSAGHSLIESFAHGEGKFLVVAAYANAAGGGCVVSWQAEGQLKRWERKHISVALSPGEVAPSPKEIFSPMEPVAREAGGLRVLVLFHVDGVRRGRASPDLYLLQDVTAMVRAVASERRIAELGLLAFSLDDGKVVAAHPFQRELDLPRVGAGMPVLNPAEVHIEELESDHVSAFWERMISDHRALFEDADLVAAVGTISPAYRSNETPSLAAVPLPEGASIAYFANARHQEVRNPVRRPRDAIERLVERMGGRTYVIRSALDLGKAVRNAIERRTSVKGGGAAR